MSKTLITTDDERGCHWLHNLCATTYNRACLTKERAQRLNENGGKFKGRLRELIDELAPPPQKPDTRNIWPIVRSKHPSFVFDPNWFFREEGWAYWKGPADGDGLRGKEEHDYRSRRLKGIDALNIEWVQVCRPNETSINGEVRLGRLKKAGHIRLDAKMFATLHDNWFRLPLRLLDQLIGGKWLTFDGTILRDPLGRRVVLAMCWEPDHVKWCARTLMSSDFDRDDLSAVLPPDTM